MRVLFVITTLVAQMLIGGLMNSARAQDAETESFGVWATRVDGSDSRLIAPGAFFPDWSPDGQHIAFAAFSAEGMGLFASAPDGTASVPILNDPAYWPLTPRWSPDGALIAFSGGAGDGTAALVGVARADGSGVVWTEPTGIAYPVALDWSPDGTRLAWTSESESTSHLWVADANGNNAVQLAELMGEIEGIAWSPDGIRLALHEEGYGDADRTSSVSVIGADGSGLTSLAEWQVGSISPDNVPFYGSPAWSSDGATIAIASALGIARIGANDGAMTLLPTPGMTTYEIAWSPDNGTFALSAPRDDEEFDEGGAGTGMTGTDVYLMNADGSDLRMLAATPLEDMYPAWSPDGGSVAFHAEPAGE
jgi:Tol biopolymer transport system component